MRTSRFVFSLCLTPLLCFLLVTVGLAAEPGEPIRDLPSAGVNDQKPGSVLFYNVYTSSATSPGAENSRISITNTGPSLIAVHLFFIEGNSCSPADSFLCLTTNQTASFLTSTYDPGAVGYLIAVATDLQTGCPIKYNYLLGDVFVKFASGHEANLTAQSIAALQAPACDVTNTHVTLNFDGVSYERLPSVVAIDNLPSRVDGNDTLLIINRPTGNLSVGADPLGTVFGLLYDDAERASSYTFSSSQCQFRFSFSNSIPRVIGRFTGMIPAGRSGWTKFYIVGESAPLLGAVINYNSGANTNGSAFSGGHNLHILKLATTSSISIPVFPLNC